MGANPKNGKPKCVPEVGKSLRKLGLKRIDLWLMHWPGPGRHLNYPPVRKGMERPKAVIEANIAKTVPADWTAAMRLDTYRHMAQYVGKQVGALVRSVTVTASFTVNSSKHCQPNWLIKTRSLLKEILSFLEQPPSVISKKFQISQLSNFQMSSESASIFLEIRGKALQPKNRQ